MDNNASNQVTTRVKGRHGGRRPGAGAPRGNTNALKTGRYSARLHALIGALRNDPVFIATYRLLIQAAAKRKSSSVRRAAAELLATLDSLTTVRLASSASDIVPTTTSKSEQLPTGATGEINQDNVQTHARKGP